MGGDWSCNELTSSTRSLPVCEGVCGFESDHPFTPFLVNASYNRTVGPTRSMPQATKKLHEGGRRPGTRKKKRAAELPIGHEPSVVTVQTRQLARECRAMCNRDNGSLAAGKNVSSIKGAPHDESRDEAHKGRPGGKRGSSRRSKDDRRSKLPGQRVGRITSRSLPKAVALDPETPLETAVSPPETAVSPPETAVRDARYLGLCKQAFCTGAAAAKAAAAQGSLQRALSSTSVALRMLRLYISHRGRDGGLHRSEGRYVCATAL